MAHIVGWTDELAAALSAGLTHAPPQALAKPGRVGHREIAADAFAFVHTGYASVAALHDVIGMA